MASVKTQGYNEKRKIERKYLVFYLRVFEGMSINVLGHVVNLSSQGMMLLSDEVIPENKNFHLRMRIPKEVSERSELLFDATSCWCKKDVNPDFFLTGFEIHSLTASDRKDIQYLLDKLSYPEG